MKLQIQVIKTGKSFFKIFPADHNLFPSMSEFGHIDIPAETMRMTCGYIVTMRMSCTYT